MGAGFEVNYKDDHREFDKLTLNDDSFGQPLDLFNTWFEKAKDSNILDYNAMTLSTSDGKGDVSSRILYLKGLADSDFCFYTNYDSKKGKDIEANPKASLLFFWKELERQIRIKGVVKKMAPELSDEYFYSRPKASQIGAVTSAQSEKIASRSALEEHFEATKEKFNQEDVKRPKNWGGYVLIPTYFEFWQGREHRLHDRISFELQEDGSWQSFRLNP